MAKDKKLTESEEKELKALEEQEAAKLAAKAAAVAASAPPASPLQSQDEPKKAAAAPAPITVGDIPVTCLKTESWCSLGTRRYELVKGREIMMDPSHADELAASGWVAKVEVVTTG